MVIKRDNKGKFVKGTSSLQEGKKRGIFKKCKVCDKKFYIYLCELSRNRQYCSSKCYGLDPTFDRGYNRGKKLPKEWVENVRKARIGKKLSKKACENIRRAKLGKLNPMWKGDEVGYGPLHSWIKRHKKKPLFCEECGQYPPYDLANISGKYKRDVNDFKWVCRRCHMKEDGRLKRFADLNRKLLQMTS